MEDPGYGSWTTEDEPSGPPWKGFLIALGVIVAIGAVLGLVVGLYTRQITGFLGDVVALIQSLLGV